MAFNILKRVLKAVQDSFFSRVESVSAFNSITDWINIVLSTSWRNINQSHSREVLFINIYPRVITSIPLDYGDTLRIIPPSRAYVLCYICLLLKGLLRTEH